jgi:carboxylesterase type B
VFQTLDRLDRPWEAVDKTVSDAVSSYWTNFARKGDPNGSGLAPWPVFSIGSHKTMQLGQRMGPMDTADAARLDFWLSVLKK